MKSIYSCKYEKLIPCLEQHYLHLLQFCLSQSNWKQSVQVLIPLMLFWLNLQFDQNLECSSLKYAKLITMKFCMCHDSYTIVTCLKFCCDQLRIFQTRALQILVKFQIQWYSVSGTGASWQNNITFISVHRQYILPWQSGTTSYSVVSLAIQYFCKYAVLSLIGAEHCIQIQIQIKVSVNWSTPHKFQTQYGHIDNQIYGNTLKWKLKRKYHNFDAKKIIRNMSCKMVRICKKIDCVIVTLHRILFSSNTHKSHRIKYSYYCCWNHYKTNR